MSNNCHINQLTKILGEGMFASVCLPMSAHKAVRDVDCPFNEIGELSDEIFGKIVSFPCPDQPEQPVDEKKDLPTSGYQKITTYLTEAIPKVGSFGFFSSEGNPPVNSTLTDSRKSKPGGLATYVSLPDDVEMLESPALFYDEEATMAAIRKIMVEQKRENSLRVLPELSPSAVSAQMENPAVEEPDCPDHASVRERHSRTIIQSCIATSPWARCLVPWLMLSLAIWIVNPQFFAVLVSVNVFSLILISLLIGIWGVSKHAMRTIQSRFCFIAKYSRLPSEAAVSPTDA